MLSRVFLLRTPTRALLSHTQCYPAACGLEIRSVSARRVPSVVSPFSSSCTLLDTPNKPGKSGDKGPAKNYLKKMRKKQRKAMASAEVGDTIFEGMEAIESFISRSPPVASHMSTGEMVNEKSRNKKKQRTVRELASGHKLEAIVEGMKAIESLKSNTRSSGKDLKKKRQNMKAAAGLKFGKDEHDALMEGVKVIESLTSEAQPAGHIASLMNTWEQKKKVAKRRKKVVGRATGSLLEAVTEGAKVMESLIDQAKAAEQRRKVLKHPTGPVFDALTEGEKMIESLATSKGQVVPGTSPVKGKPKAKARYMMSSKTARKEQEEVEDLDDMFPDDVYRFSGSGSSTQATSLGGGLRRGKEGGGMDSRAPKLAGRGVEYDIDFTDPSSGKRLGLFHHPKPGTKVMPRSKPTLAEEDELRELQELFLLKPTTHFEEQMEGAMTTTIQYPRTFPIDNDDYYKDHKEASVGFEEHVLLDHLLEGFPKKGPVRHFMELVVTGLSKNPHYTAAEKRQCVEWYKDYFSEFTSKELQSL